MGHERVGVLPHTKPWLKVVAQLSGLSNAESSVSEIANSTLQNVRKQFREIHTDTGVKAAFEFLISLSASGLPQPKSLNPQIDILSNPSPLKLVSILQAWVDAHSQSLEYADIARRSAADAIGNWTSQQKQQPSLFDKANKTQEIWRKAGNGAAFCEISRTFFAKFTERYLKYFLCRAASSVLPDANRREDFDVLFGNHIDVVSRYAFETSKITQSFAAGWFNKYVRGNKVSGSSTDKFLRIAFGKIQDELLREVSNQ